MGGRFEYQGIGLGPIFRDSQFTGDAQGVEEWIQVAILPFLTGRVVGT